MTDPSPIASERFARFVLRLWALALVAIAVAISLPNKSGKLYPTFVDAGHNFSHGLPLYGVYDEGRDQFRYSPVVAASFAPWTLVPASLGGILWRWSQAVLLLLALRAWSRQAVPPVPWPWLLLLALPMVGGNIHNGQLNPLVLALLLGGVVAFQRNRLWLAAAAIVAATMFKIYPIALGLLLVIVEPRRFLPRLIVTLVAGALLPFALQDPQYVRQQLLDWQHRLLGDDRSNLPIYAGYHDFQKILRLWGMPIALESYRIIEVAAGGLMALLLVRGRLVGWSRDRSIHAACSLGFLWMTLFGPATETATYILLAAVACHAAIAVTGRPLWERILVRGAYGLLISVTVALWFPPVVSDPWRSFSPQSFGALLLLFWVVRNCLKEDRGIGLKASASA